MLKTDGNNTSSGKETEEGQHTEIYADDFFLGGKKTSQNLIFYLYKIKPHPDKDTHHLLNTKTLSGICCLGASKGQIEVRGIIHRYVAQPGSQHSYYQLHKNVS